MYDETCVFCREIVRNGHGAFVFKGDNVIAFMDNAPIEEGHVLVIPRDHYENIYDIDPDVYLDLQLEVKKIAIAVRSILKSDGINIGQNNGRIANQVVMHYHVHIIPRYIRRNINWEREKTSVEKLESIAEKLKYGLKEVEI